MQMSKRLDRFGAEIFAALNEKKLALEQSGRQIYNMSIGTPDFAPAEVAAPWFSPARPDWAL